MTQKGWHSRGYLPHFDGSRCQFVTIHLADSLPRPLLDKFSLEKNYNKLGYYYDAEFREKIEGYLDRGIGKCILARNSIAAMVENALLFHDQTRYDLRSWVIMPNHAHVLFDPKPSVSLSNIMKDFKGFTARQANKMLNSSGTIWHPDYFDTYIRNQKHYDTVVAYIENNPVIAGLCAEPGDWPFGSARFAANNAAKL